MSEQGSPEIGEIRRAPDGKAFAWTGQGWVPVAWTGNAWVLAPEPIVKKRRNVLSWLIVAGALLLIGIGYAIARSSGPQDANAQKGITNLTWNTGEITFDYQAGQTCTVKFHYVFLDDQGSVLDEADDVSADSVTQGDDYHITITPATSDDSVPSTTHRIEITPNCQ